MLLVTNDRCMLSFAGCVRLLTELVSAAGSSPVVLAPSQLPPHLILEFWHHQGMT